VFTVNDRDRVRNRVLELASSDRRVVAGAVLGSLAHDDGDRWSDLDLMFAVAKGVPVTDVLEAWSRTLVRELDAVRLFDLPRGPVVYRVFLLPGCLQLDLSFAPASEFGAGGPKFRLLFGTAVEKPYATSRPADELFGYAVHHALRARFCIERGRSWQAEFWISGVRDYALALACRRRGLDGEYGRDFDDLPADVLAPFEAALVRSPESDELRRALASAVAGLLRESAEAADLAARVEPQLREVALEWETASPSRGA
jgi:predicted nucleotidyltransferase